MTRAVIGIGISIAFIAITVSRVELTLLADAWARVGYGLLAIPLGISMLELLVRAVRWRLLLRPFLSLSIPAALALLAMGHLANAILPARLGDLARALVTGSRTGSSRTSVLGTIAVERIADAGLLGLAAAIGVLIGYAQLAPAVIALGLAALAATSAAGVAAVVLGRDSVAATRAGRLFAYHGRRFLIGGTALRHPDQLVRVATLTVASFALTVALLWTVTYAVGLSLPIWQAALVMATVTLSTAIPAGPASIGTYEFAGVMVLTAMGHPAESSLVAVAIVHVIVVVPPALIGLGATWLMSMRPSEVKAPMGAPPQAEHAP